jgi:hypothetical protein
MFGHDGCSIEHRFGGKACHRDKQETPSSK